MRKLALCFARITGLNIGAPRRDDMPFDPQTYRHPPRRQQPSGPNGRRFNDDDKMGLVLLAVAIVAFGAYTLMVFAGIMSPAD